MQPSPLLSVPSHLPSPKQLPASQRLAMPDHDFIRFLAASLLLLLRGRGTMPDICHPGHVSAYLLLTSSASILLRPTTAQQVNARALVSLRCYIFHRGGNK